MAYFLNDDYILVGGFIDRGPVPLVITSANSFFTRVRTVSAAAVVDMLICFSRVFA
jgi:hypothetical protein